MRVHSNFHTNPTLYEINFGWSQKVKIYHFNNFLCVEFWFLRTSTWKCKKFPKTQKFLAAKMVKMGLQNGINWFHIKSEWQNDTETVTLYTVEILQNSFSSKKLKLTGLDWILINLDIGETQNVIRLLWITTFWVQTIIRTYIFDSWTFNTKTRT